MLLCPDGELRVLAQCTFASVYICRNPLAQTAYSSFMHAHDDDDDDEDAQTTELNAKHGYPHCQMIRNSSLPS